MSDITISYKGNSIATMDASGTKTLLTEGKYCEDDITIDYTQPSGGGFSYPWGGSLETVTIGANSVSNMNAAAGYFSSYVPWGMFVLKTTPTQNNQVVAYGQTCLRYRNGSIQTTGSGSSYDGILVEGTQYDVYRVNY